MALAAVISFEPPVELPIDLRTSDNEGWPLSTSAKGQLVPWTLL